MSKHIITIPIADETFVSNISVVASYLKSLYELPCDTSSVVLDLSHHKFCYPLTLLPIAAYYHKLLQVVSDVKINYPSKDSYLTTIHFPACLEVSDTFDQSYLENILDRFTQKTYIPLIQFSTSASATMLTKRSLLNRTLHAIIDQNLESKLKNEYINGVNFLVSESVGNILDHAESPFGYVGLQVYPQKGYMDICIADTGQTILGSYARAGFDEVTDDEQALRKALSGQSVKAIDDGRGFGIRKSKDMVINGLNGYFLLWSGKSLYLSKRGKAQLINRSASSEAFGGTLVGMRIQIDNSTFRYLDHLE
jgi:anti-sigma regulatory factor (Ser/Thr protein kinase)